MPFGFLEDLADAVVDLGEAVVGAAEVIVDTVTDVGGAVAGAVVSTGQSIFDVGSTLTEPIWGIGEAAIDFVSDPIGAAQALGEVISDPIGAVEGAFGAVIDYGVGLGSEIGDVGSSVAHGVYGVGEAVVASSLDIAGSAGGIIGDALAGTAGLANAALGGYGDEALNLIDDYVLDTVDVLTLGTVDVDFDNGALTASVGVDDFMGVGVGVSSDGVTAGVDAPLLGFDLGLTDSDGATLLLDENIPGVELPGGARVGLGIDDEGGAGVIAIADDLFGISVGIVGDYDADITLEQVQALGGSGSSPRTAAQTDVTGFDADVSDASDSFGDGAGFESPAPAPEPLTDFAQDVIEADQVESTTDDVWDDLG